MIDEMWMRTWSDGHGRFSADMDRGFKRLADGVRRFGQWMAPPSLPGADSFFARTAARCGIGTKQV